MSKKSICLNMIVKNESAVILKCLESVRDLIDYWVIVDTGSTDGTQKIIQEFLKDIPGELYERPWVDFAHNRNEALELARMKADYLLFIDADDYLEFSSPFEWPDLDKDCYVVDFVHGNCRSQRVLFCTSKIDWKWEGIVHETIDFSKADGEYLPHIVYMTSVKGHRTQNSRNKYLRDAQILEEAISREAQNSRYVFHLATSYEGACEYAKAMKNFQKRVEMGGDHQEVFYSLYRIGVYQEQMNQPQEVILNSFLKAYQYRPYRIEPLYCMASYFMDRQNYLLAYVLLDLAVSIPIQHDFCYTQMDIYEYGALDLFSECAFRIGKYQEALSALKRLLAVPNLPEDIRRASEKNLALPVFEAFR